MPPDRHLKSIGEIYSIFAVDRFHFLSTTYPLCKVCAEDQVKGNQDEVESPIFSFWGLGHYSYFLIGREGDLEKKVLYQVDRDWDQKEDREGDREKQQTRDPRDQQKIFTYYGLSGTEHLLHDINSSYWSLFWESVILQDSQDANKTYQPIEEALKRMSDDDVLLWIRLRYDSHFSSPEGQNILNFFNDNLKKVTENFYLLRSSSWPNVSYLLIINWAALKKVFNKIIKIFGPHLVRSDTYVLFPVHTLYGCDKNNKKQGTNVSFVTRIFILGKNYREVIMAETDEFELHIENFESEEDGLNRIKAHSQRKDIPRNARKNVISVEFSLESSRSLIDNIFLIKANIGDKFVFYLKFIHMEKIDRGQQLYQIRLKEDDEEGKSESGKVGYRNQVVLKFSRAKFFSKISKDKIFYIAQEYGFQKNSMIRIKGFRKTQPNDELQELFTINLESRCLLSDSLIKKGFRSRSPLVNFIKSIKNIDPTSIRIELLTGVTDVQVHFEASSPLDLLRKLSSIQKYADRYGLLIKTLTSLEFPR